MTLQVPVLTTCTAKGKSTPYLSLAFVQVAGTHVPTRHLIESCLVDFGESHA